MSYLPPENSPPDPNSDPTWTTLALPRAETIAQLQKKNVCDILIVGGGIGGATLARLAAFNGLRTVLLERNDYASGTSGRTSKMAHGGLRYLAMLDFKQVAEGLSSREDLFLTAPHLVQPHRFLIPIRKGDWMGRVKYGAGLSLYDLFARAGAARRHRWMSGAELADTPLASQSGGLAGCFSFIDGLMDDTRLVHENILAARQEGATCLNYAECASFEQRRDNSVIAGWTDRLRGTHHEIETGLVINCAGAWAPTIGRLTPAAEFGEVQYSRGAHLLFNKPWKGPALLFPLPARGQNYFVWPHPAGTLVGTTDHPMARPEWDPVPTPAEVNEILARLARDLPGSGLTRETLHYGFAGIRTLPLRKSGSGSTSAISRRHLWIHTPGMLSLLGGKYTSAAWSAADGLKKVYELSNVASPLITLEGRKFPGAGRLQEAALEFKNGAAGISPALVERALARFGSRVRQFNQFSDPLRVVGGTILSGEIDLAMQTEQVESLEDLMRRRLGLEYLPDAGFAALDEIGARLKAARPEIKIEQEIAAYRSRIESIRKNLQTVTA